ncbi:YceD family protein [Thiomicrospira sp. R3]|uniref:YceD family protein n=1 Tax=Thiomicrospira sp. R3 TaxID=3035472 RepID=UPI00259B3F1D|nr:YceD family protein [Thiomicrospira sp. R3]WFE67984.1 YceD family protein [Thiomicrospira sp. R3]
MFEKIPDLIDPVQCAEHNRRFNAAVKQSDLKRLRQQLVSSDEMIVVDLAFKRHPKLKAPMFTLQVKTRLCLECQRSLQPFWYEVDSEISGVYLPSLALAEGLDEEVEVYALPEGKISTYELIEEEVLLAIPMVPRQDKEILTWQADSLGDESEAVHEDKPNPFAMLQKLRT